MKPAIVGFATIAVCVAALAWLIPDDQVRQPMWLFVFLAVATCAKFLWAHPRSPKAPAGWIAYAAMAGGLGLVLVIIDALLYGQSSMHIVLDLSLSVLAVIVAVSGFARSLVLGGQNGA
jgi:FtsH-binding integral membrane protein